MRASLIHLGYNHAGHGTTDYRAWLTGYANGKSFASVDCFRSNRYEPYVVLRKTPWTPRYEERFTGYGKNKIQHLVHLRYAGWRFSVIGRSFLTHFPHHKSAARVEWEGATDSEGNVAATTRHRRHMDRLYRRFLDELAAAYGPPGENPGHTRICNTR